MPCSQVESSTDHSQPRSTEFSCLHFAITMSLVIKFFGVKYVLLLILIAVAFELKIKWSHGNSGFPRDRESRLSRAELILTEYFGPESLAFDSSGRGPYTGVSGGRVVRWNGPEQGWSDFAIISPNRTQACDAKFQFVPDLDNEQICGRPLGIRFHPHTGDLYIADAYYGLRVVGPEGGYARPLVTEAEGIPLGFTNDVDFGDDGSIFFTDSSSRYHRRDFVSMFVGGDDTGRLLSHNIKTNKTKVLLNGLRFPNGIAVNNDKSFLLLSETLPCRIMRYWLKGPKAGLLEHFCLLPGYPDNVRLTENGDFWVAIHSEPNVLSKMPIFLRRYLLKLHLPFTGWYTTIATKVAKAMIIRLNPDGEILEVLEDKEGKVVRLVSEVQERKGKLWMGSAMLSQIAVY